MCSKTTYHSKICLTLEKINLAYSRHYLYTFSQVCQVNKKNLSADKLKNSSRHCCHSRAFSRRRQPPAVVGTVFLMEACKGWFQWRLGRVAGDKRRCCVRWLWPFSARNTIGFDLACIYSIVLMRFLALLKANSNGFIERGVPSDLRGCVRKRVLVGKYSLCWMSFGAKIRWRWFITSQVPPFKVLPR